MPLPLVPVIAALAAGGTLVPHAAGGLIVTSASGYIAGTYLSTAAITVLLAAGATALGTGAAVVYGIAAGIIGGAGIFGTMIGASGITAFLMYSGIIVATPVWVPVAIAGAGVGVSYGAFMFYRLRNKLHTTPEGEEALFSEAEAKVIEWLFRRFKNVKNNNA
jgi:hypothetical protein